MSQRAFLLKALREAGLRGLTDREMARLVGETWRLRVRELEAEGCHFVRHNSRYRGRARGEWMSRWNFRLVLVLEGPLADDFDGALKEPAQVALFDEPSNPSQAIAA